MAWAATAARLVRVDARLPSILTIKAGDGLPSNDLRSVVVGSDRRKNIGSMLGVFSHAGF